MSNTVTLIVSSLAVDVAISLAILIIIALRSSILWIVVLAAVIALLVVRHVATGITLAWLESLGTGLERGSARSERCCTRILSLVVQIHLLSLPGQVVVLSGGIIFPRVEVRHVCGLSTMTFGICVGRKKKKYFEAHKVEDCECWSISR